MTVQAERPTEAINSDRPKGRQGAVALLSVAVVIAVAIAATVIGLHHSGGKQPNPALGRALQSLPAYRVELPTDSGQARSATMEVHDLGRPGHSSRLQKVPTFTLHVEYAHVRQVAGRWQLMITAPEGRTFDVGTTQGQFYDVLVKGQAVTLFFVGGTQGPGADHGTNFAFGGGPNSMTMNQAVALAHTLTTSVRVG